MREHSLFRSILLLRLFLAFAVRHEYGNVFLLKEKTQDGFSLRFFICGKSLRDGTSCALEVIGFSHRLRVQPLAVWGLRK